MDERLGHASGSCHDATQHGVVNYLTVKPLLYQHRAHSSPAKSGHVLFYASGLTIRSTVSIAEVTSQLEQAETAAFQDNAEHIKRVASVLILSVSS